MGIASRLIAIVCMAVGVASAQPATAREHVTVLHSVAAARLGLIGSRTPRMGPLLVLRGGYVAVKDMVRPRFVGGMIDIYPSTHTGFRFSIGDRYFAKPNFWREAEQATNGLLFDPRMIRGGVGLQQRVYRRRTPAALVGYDVEMAPGLVAGFEAGTLFGRAINPGPRGARGFSADKTGMAGGRGLNPVATFAVRFAF